MVFHVLVPNLLDEYSPGEYEVLIETMGESRISTIVSEIPSGSIVIPRFRAIPFGLELQQEVEAHGSLLINTYHQHRNIANIFAWSHLLDGITPKSYAVADVPNLPEGKYFVKGETNSLKNQGPSSVFADNKREVIELVHTYLNDMYLGNQEVAIRPRQNYRKLGETVTGLPVFHERRIFVHNGTPIVDGFYWSTWGDGSSIKYSRNEFMKTLEETLSRVSHLAEFFVIDMAEYPDGSWGVVELNDGCMSGLSGIDPNHLWKHFC